MFVKRYVSGGIEYARLLNAKRGPDGGRFDELVYHLGRVIDFEQGIYRNRDRGTYRYVLGEGFGDVEDSKKYLEIAYGQKLEMILDFGPEYFIIETLKKDGLFQIFTDAFPKDSDTLMSLVLHKMLWTEANLYAEDFWRTSYCRIAYPQAKLASQRISEFLRKIGDEIVVRNFFGTYLTYISQKAGTSDRNILIDSTGLPNDCQMGITATNVHNGVASHEVRLILVMDRVTGYPLYFRYVKGTIVDVSTLVTTIDEVKRYGIDVGHCIIDAGYYSSDNMESLNESEIPFVIRLKSGNDIYDYLVQNHLEGLDTLDNCVVYGNRAVFIKRVEIDFHGKSAFAYVSIDQAEQAKERGHILLKPASKFRSEEERQEQYATSGVFIIISKEQVDIQEILPLYFSRQAIEQVFDFSKNYANLLPLRIHDETTFRGHLLISFMATVSIMTIDRLLSKAQPKSKKPKFNFLQARSCLRQMKCEVYPDRIIPIEPDAKSKAILNALKIEVMKKIVL